MNTPEDCQAAATGLRLTLPVQIRLGRELTESERSALNVFLSRREALQAELQAAYEEELRLMRFLKEAMEQLPVLEERAHASLARQDFIEARACADQIAAINARLEQQTKADLALGDLIGKCLPEMALVSSLLRECESLLRKETAAALRPFCKTETEALGIALQTSAAQFCRQLITEEFTPPSREMFGTMGSRLAARHAQKQEKLCRALLNNEPVAVFDYEAMQTPDPNAAEKAEIAEEVAMRNIAQATKFARAGV